MTTVAKVIELTASSPKSIEDAVETGIDIAKHLHDETWEKGALREHRSIRSWPAPEPASQRSPQPRATAANRRA